MKMHCCRSIHLHYIKGYTASNTTASTQHCKDALLHHNSFVRSYKDALLLPLHHTHHLRTLVQYMLGCTAIAASYSYNFNTLISHRCVASWPLRFVNPSTWAAAVSLHYNSTILVIEWDLNYPNLHYPTPWLSSRYFKFLISQKKEKTWFSAQPSNKRIPVWF